MTRFSYDVTCQECGGDLQLLSQDGSGARIDAVLQCLDGECRAQLHLNTRLMTVIAGKQGLAEQRRVWAAEAI